MSARNTGLFVRGHVPAERIAALIWAHPSIRPGDLVGDEAPRAGHGRRDGRDYTLVALRLFEQGGVLLLESPECPPEDELEQALGRALSADGGAAVFLHHDEERGAGGHALFRDGALVSRLVYDGKAYQPVVRDLAGERPYTVEDEEAWLWEDIARAVELGATAVLGPGVRTDDDIAACIDAAAVRPVPPPAGAPRAPTGTPAGAASPGGQRLRGLLRRLAGRSAS